MTDENETNFDEILDALTKEFASEPLQREPKDRVLFSIDDQLGVALFTVNADDAQVDGIAAVIVLGPAPAGNAELMQKLLCANYLGAETADGTLAIDEEAGCLVLTRFFTLPIDVEDFMTAFARLVNAARYWSDIVFKELGADEEGDHVMKV